MRRASLWSLLLVVGLASLSTAANSAPSPTATDRMTTKPLAPDLFNDGKVRLVIRCDDIGFCHAANMAFEKIADTGKVSAVSVIVNTPWLDEAVEILKRHPEISVGVHCCLNSEWVPYRWGPVLPAKEVPSLVDEWGKFF